MLSKRTFLYIREIIILIKRPLYYVFSLNLLILGASFMVPQLWEAIFNLVVAIFNTVYGQDIPYLESGSYQPQTKDYVIGCFIIGFGIATFYIFHHRSGLSVAASGEQSLANLFLIWKGARDLDKDKEDVHLEDLVNALNIVNETGSILYNESKGTFDNFYNERGQDFLTLYDKLNENGYMLENRSVKQLLNDKAKYVNAELINIKDDRTRKTA